jgi:hypothetical protein
MRVGAARDRSLQRVSRACVLLCVLLWCARGVPRVDAASVAPSADEMFLSELVGDWVMTGSLGTQPLRYTASGRRVLDGAFIELHMVDTGTPPGYEAEVFLGFDRKANDYIAHWLDRFGAAGARVVGRGKRHAERLVLIFPYAEGAFRDTLTWRAASQSWFLRLESQDKNGTWSDFATYTLTRDALSKR